MSASTSQVVEPVDTGLIAPAAPQTLLLEQLMKQKDVQVGSLRKYLAYTGIDDSVFQKATKKHLVGVIGDSWNESDAGFASFWDDYNAALEGEAIRKMVKATLMAYFKNDQELTNKFLQHMAISSLTDKSVKVDDLREFLIDYTDGYWISNEDIRAAIGDSALPENAKKTSKVKPVPNVAKMVTKLVKSLIDSGSISDAAALTDRELQQAMFLRAGLLMESLKPEEQEKILEKMTFSVSLSVGKQFNEFNSTKAYLNGLTFEQITAADRTPTRNINLILIFVAFNEENLKDLREKLAKAIEKKKEPRKAASHRQAKDLPKLVQAVQPNMSFDANMNMSFDMSNLDAALPPVGDLGDESMADQVQQPSQTLPDTPTTPSTPTTPAEQPRRMRAARSRVQNMYA